jgi:hypothetical protein
MEQTACVLSYTEAREGWFDKAGEAEPAVIWGGNKLIDSHFWGLIFSCIKLDLNDLLERWLNVVRQEYGTQDSFLFDEWSEWDGTPSSHYTMRRTMGMFLVLLAELIKRSKPRYQKRFEKILERHGSQVVILTPTQTDSDEYAYDPELSTTVFVENLTIDEKIVKAGAFTTEDIWGYFRAFTPVEQHHRIEWGTLTYQVQTVKKRRHGDRILWVEVVARKLIE